MGGHQHKHKKIIHKKKGKGKGKGKNDIPHNHVGRKQDSASRPKQNTHCPQKEWED